MVELDQIFSESDSTLNTTADLAGYPEGRIDYESVLNRQATYASIQTSRGYILYSLDMGDDRKIRMDLSAVRWLDQTFVLCPNANVTGSQTELSALTIPASDNTASTQSWSLVEQWLGHCLSSHARCNELGNDLWYPTRLLDVGNGTGLNRWCGLWRPAKKTAMDITLH